MSHHTHSLTNNYQPTRTFQAAFNQEMQHSKAQLLRKIFTDVRQGYRIDSYDDLVTRYLPETATNGYAKSISTCIDDSIDDIESGKKATNQQHLNTTNPTNPTSPTSDTKILNRIKLDGQYVYAEDIDGGKVFDDELKNLDITVCIVDGQQLYHQNVNGGKVFDSNGNDIGITQDGKYVLRK